MRLELKFKCKACGKEFCQSSDEAPGVATDALGALQKLLNEDNLTEEEIIRRFFILLTQPLYQQGHSCERHQRWQSYGVAEIIGVTYYPF